MLNILLAIYLCQLGKAALVWNTGGEVAANYRLPRTWHKERAHFCLFECILNSSEALNGTQLNVDNARRLIEKLVGNYKDFVDVYTQALQTCTANETDLLKFKRRRFLGSETCSALPLYLASCVLKKSFINCPSANWTHSEKCENAREFSMNCNRFSGGVLVADFVL
ncbi:GH19745 [Drosophila grimshawi]|uniref:GH19745 n=1 Tax=Drosophila grimshawi TaxID=7222 RepID=B4J479_DROGR|nr:GH19745 [Drosophila grimshawi]